MSAEDPETGDAGAEYAGAEALGAAAGTPGGAGLPTGIGVPVAIGLLGTGVPAGAG